MVRRRTLILTAFPVTLALAGCKPEVRVVRESFPEIRKLAGQMSGNTSFTDEVQPEPERRAAPIPTDPGWGIVLESFEGPTATKQAEARARALARDLRADNIQVKDRGGAAVVFRGPYPAADVDAARRELRDTRLAEINGTKPFERVALVPLGAGARGGADALDARPLFGQGSYSLQVAAFDSGFGKDYRKAAEDYARQLRDEEVEAYYLHAREMSMVFVGLFTDADFAQREMLGAGGVPFKQQVYGPRVLELQERFPYNLYNGYTIIQKSRGGEKREQPSFLVRLQDLPD